MDPYHAIIKLKEQKHNSFSVDFDVWLDLTLTVFVDCFGVTNQRWTNISNLVNNYRTARIFDKSQKLQVEYRTKAEQFIDEAVRYLEHQVSILKEKANQQESLQSRRIKELEQTIRNMEMVEANRPKPVIPPPEIITKTTTVYPVGRSGTAFASIALVVLSGAFGLGFYFGNFKFDKDKTQFFTERNDLMSDTIALHRTINWKDSLLKVKADSLTRLNKTVEGLSRIVIDQSSKSH